MIVLETIELARSAPSDSVHLPLRSVFGKSEDYVYTLHVMTDIVTLTLCYPKQNSRFSFH
jgi:hypothetical protein